MSLIRTQWQPFLSKVLPSFSAFPSLLPTNRLHFLPLILFLITVPFFPLVLTLFSHNHSSSLLSKHPSLGPLTLRCLNPMFFSTLFLLIHFILHLFVFISLPTTLLKLLLVSSLTKWPSPGLLAPAQSPQPGVSFLMLCNVYPNLVHSFSLMVKAADSSETVVSYLPN